MVSGTDCQQLGISREGHGRDELPQNLSQERPSLDRHARFVILAAAQLSTPLAIRRDGDERAGIRPPFTVEAVPQPSPEVRVLKDHKSVRGDDRLIEEGVEARSLRVISNFTNRLAQKRKANNPI